MNVREECGPEAAESDEELRLSRWMKLAQGGDADAYRRLLTELDAMLEKYTTRALRRASPGGDVSFARDVVQEVLLAIHAKRHTYDPALSFLPWVFGIARHKLVDCQRRQGFERRHLDFEFEIETVAAAEPALARAFSPDGAPSEGLYALLEKLHPRQRQVLELTKLQGLSVAEAAALAGVSEANVKVLTHRGITALRKLMEEGAHE